MRTFERELLVLAVLGAALLLRRPRPWAGWIFGAASLAAMAAQVWVEGARFQVVPLYLALLLATMQLTRAGGPRSRTVWAFVLATLCATALLLCWLLPAFQLPVPTGPDRVGSLILDLTDPTRGTDGVPGTEGRRPLVVQLWYPAQPATGRHLQRYVRPSEVKPFFRYQSQIATNSWADADPSRDRPAMPLILFGPMWGGRRTLDTFLLEDLASHGYVVAAVDHPGNAARVQLAGGRLMLGTKSGAISTEPDSTVEGVEAAWARELAVWAADDEFILDQLGALTSNAGPWNGRIDLSRVGALGHSFGGASSLNLLGQDPRVRSAVNLDGWTFGALAHRTADQAMLILYEGSDEAVPQGDSVDDQLERQDQASVETNLAHLGGTLGYIAGAQHLDFTDQTLVSPVQRLTYTGPIRGERMRQITRQLVLSFFDQTLRSGSGDSLTRLPGHPEVKLEQRRSPLPLSARAEPTPEPSRPVPAR